MLTRCRADVVVGVNYTGLQVYGLGLMHTFPSRGWAWAPDPKNVTYTIGHAGADYGSLGARTLPFHSAGQMIPPH